MRGATGTVRSSEAGLLIQINARQDRGQLLRPRGALLFEAELFHAGVAIFCYY